MGSGSKRVPRHMVEGRPSILLPQSGPKESSGLQASEVMGDARYAVAEVYAFRLNTAVFMVIMRGGRVATPLFADGGGGTPPYCIIAT